MLCIQVGPFNPITHRVVHLTNEVIAGKHLGRSKIERSIHDQQWEGVWDPFLGGGGID